MPVSTVVLVRRARNGDYRAWDEIVERYYSSWMRKFHGELGHTVRKLFDTEDIVQSAIADAIRDLPSLRNEAAFFTWVTSIIRHKVSGARRRAKHSAEPLPGARADALADGGDPSLIVVARDTYHQTLDVILKTFPESPEAMAAVVMRFFDGLSIDEMVERFGRPRRTVYRWLKSGTELLKSKLRS